MTAKEPKLDTTKRNRYFKTNKHRGGMNISGDHLSVTSLTPLSSFWVASRSVPHKMKDMGMIGSFRVFRWMIWTPNDQPKFGYHIIIKYNQLNGDKTNKNWYWAQISVCGRPWPQWSHICVFKDTFTIHHSHSVFLESQFDPIRPISMELEPLNMVICEKMPTCRSCIYIYIYIYIQYVY